MNTERHNFPMNDLRVYNPDDMPVGPGEKVVVIKDGKKGTVDCFYHTDTGVRAVLVKTQTGLRPCLMYEIRRDQSPE